MRPFKILILTMLSILTLSGCGNYTPGDELISEKYIEKEEYHKKGKLYSDNVYMIKTNERLYRVTDAEAFTAEDIYYSYNIGDKVTFYTKSSYTIVRNKRK